MAQLNVYKVTSLPVSPNANSIYLVKGASDTEVTMFVTDNAGTARPLKAIVNDKLETGVIELTSGTPTFVFDLSTLSKGSYFVTAVGTDTSGTDLSGTCLVHKRRIDVQISQIGMTTNVTFGATGTDLTALQSSGSTRNCKFYIKFIGNL